VIILRQGKVVLHTRLDELRKRTETRVALRTQGDASSLCEALSARGHTPSLIDGEVCIPLADAEHAVPTLLRELQDALSPASPTRVLQIPAQLRAPKDRAPTASPTFYVAVGVTLTLVVLAGVLTLATRRPSAPPAVTAHAPAAPPAAPPRPTVVASPVQHLQPAPPAAPPVAPRPAASGRRRGTPRSPEASAPPLSVEPLVERPAERPVEHPADPAPTRPRIAPLREYR
jgi:hypothetical protein